MRSKRKKTFKSNQGHLPLKRVVPTEEQPSHIRFFEADCEEVMVHSNYNRCIGGGCSLCERGDLPRLAYLLPVLDLKAKRIGVLLIPDSEAPGSLNDLVETIHSHPGWTAMDFILGKENRMSFFVESITNQQSDYGWIPNTVKRFNEHVKKTELILAALRDAPSAAVGSLSLVALGLE